MTLLSCSYCTTGVPSFANGKSAKSCRRAQGHVGLLDDTHEAWDRCRSQDPTLWLRTLRAACAQALRSRSRFTTAEAGDKGRRKGFPGFSNRPPPGEGPSAGARPGTNTIAFKGSVIPPPQGGSAPLGPPASGGLCPPWTPCLRGASPPLDPLSLTTVTII